MDKKTVNRLINKGAVSYRHRCNNSNFDDEYLNEFNTAVINGDIKTVPFGKNKLGERRYLFVNTAIKGNSGDIVMWVDDNGHNHTDRLSKAVRPMNIVGKVEEVVTKL